MSNVKKEINSREKRHKRIRQKIKGTKTRPRFSVFRSNKHIFLQLIDDVSGKTLISASDLNPLAPTVASGQAGGKKKGAKVEVAKEIGKKLAELALEKKIKQVVFDRGGYKYHGRVKAVSEGAKEGGLKF